MNLIKHEACMLAGQRARGICRVATLLLHSITTLEDAMRDLSRPRQLPRVAKKGWDSHLLVDSLDLSFAFFVDTRIVVREQISCVVTLFRGQMQ